MNQKKTFSLEMLAAFTNCQLIGNSHHVISGVADLETAAPQDASFFF